MIETEGQRTVEKEVLKQTEIEPGQAEPTNAHEADSSASAAPNKRKRVATGKNNRTAARNVKQSGTRKRKSQSETGKQDPTNNAHRQETEAKPVSVQSTDSLSGERDLSQENLADTVQGVTANISGEIKLQAEIDGEALDALSADAENTTDTESKTTAESTENEIVVPEDVSAENESDAAQESETEAPDAQEDVPADKENDTMAELADEEIATQESVGAEIESEAAQESVTEEIAQEDAALETEPETKQDAAAAEPIAEEDICVETERETENISAQEDASTEEKADEADEISQETVSEQQENSDAAQDDVIEEDTDSAQAEEKIAFKDAQESSEEITPDGDETLEDIAQGDAEVESELSQEDSSMEEASSETPLLEREAEAESETEPLVLDQEETSEAENAEEFEEEFEKKRFSMFRFFMGSTAVFTFMSALFVVMLFLLSDSPLLKPKEEVVLPYFGGKKLETIQANPEYSQFHFEVIDIYTNEQSAGTVVDQSPKPPKNVKENAKIILRVSAGQHRVEVPTVAGMTRADAKLAFSENDLNMMVKPEQSDSVKEGSVVRTEPVAGTTVDAGETIVVYVSQGKALDENTVVPGCTGISSGKASQLLTQRSLTLGLVNRVASDAPVGTVISQSPAAGSPARRGSAVALTVSKGADAPVVTNADGGDHAHSYVKTSTTAPTASGVGFSTYTCTICQMATYGDFQNPTG